MEKTNKHEEFSKVGIFRSLDYFKPQEKAKEDAERTLESNLRLWAKKEFKEKGIPEQEQAVYLALIENIVGNKNKLEKLSEYLSQYKIFGYGADTLVGFAGGTAVKSAVRSFLKWTWFGIAGAGAGTAAGLVSGGVFGFFREKFAAERLEYNAEKWQEYLNEKSEEELEAIALAIKNAIKEYKVKGNKEEALNLVMRLRQIDATLINSRAERINLMPGEVLANMEESAKRNSILNPKAQEILDNILKEKSKAVKKRAVKGALKGAAFGAVGGAIADWLFGTNDGKEVVEKVKAGAGFNEVLSKTTETADVESLGNEGVKKAGETILDKTELTDMVTMKKGDTVWGIVKNYLENSGIDNPTPKQILEASKEVVFDPDNSIAVKIWNIDGKIEDIKLPTGFKLDVSSLKEFIEQKGWAVPEIPVEQVAEKINVPPEELVSKTHILEPSKSLRNWLLFAGILSLAGGGGILAKEYFSKRKEKEKKAKKEESAPKSEIERGSAVQPKEPSVEKKVDGGTAENTLSVKTKEEQREEKPQGVEELGKEKEEGSEEKERKIIEPENFAEETKKSFKQIKKIIEKSYEKKLISDKERKSLDEIFLKIHGIFNQFESMPIDSISIKKAAEKISKFNRPLYYIFKNKGEEAKKLGLLLIFKVSKLGKSILRETHFKEEKIIFRPKSGLSWFFEKALYETEKKMPGGNLIEEYKKIEKNLLK